MKTVLKKIAWTIGLVCVLALVCAGLMALTLNPMIPISGMQSLDVSKLTLTQSQVLATDKNGTQLDYDVACGRILVRLVDLPTHTINAFLAIEDNRYFQHDGVDGYRMLGAAWRNLQSMKFREGASTITQQLIKNTHLSNQKTLTRKINEIRLAFELENRLTKQQILESYLNMLYFGRNIYGLGTASDVILDKPAAYLSISQSALLAAIINNPSRYSPYTALDSALTRRDLVLRQMRKHGYINTQQMKDAMAEQINICHHHTPLEQVCNEVNAQVGTLLHKYPSASVQTTFDSQLTQRLAKIVDIHDSDDFDIHFVLIDNTNQSILSTYCTAPSTKRHQPASLIKPILCYAPALESGAVSPLTPILDQETDFGSYRPRNFNDKYYGWVSVQDSLARSLNIPAVKLLELNGIERAKSFARRMGIEFDARDNHLALALGGFSRGVTLTSLTSAYSTFANLGKYQPARIVTSLTVDGVNKLPSNSCRQVMRPDTAALINVMLRRAVTDGTASSLASLPYQVCAKTGTTGTREGNSDAYCMAYTSEHTLGVWVGSEQLLRNNITGGTLPTKLARELLAAIYSDHHPADLPLPSTVKKASVDADQYRTHHRVVGTQSTDSSQISGYFSVLNMPKIPKYAQGTNGDLQFLLNREIAADYAKFRSNADNFQIVDTL